MDTIIHDNDDIICYNGDYNHQSTASNRTNNNVMTLIKHRIVRSMTTSCSRLVVSRTTTMMLMILMMMFSSTVSLALDSNGIKTIHGNDSMVNEYRMVQGCVKNENGIRSAVANSPNNSPIPTNIIHQRDTHRTQYRQQSVLGHYNLRCHRIMHI